MTRDAQPRRHPAPEAARADPSAGAGPDGSPAAGSFQALAQALADQLEAARTGRLDRVEELAGRVDALLADARRAGVQASDADRRRLLDLHARVRLALAQQQDELGRRHRLVRRGKRGTRAYAETSDLPRP
jgi:hypothetical protein